MSDALWVFGYGSLIWRPGFDFAERQPALLEGLHRSFCVISHVHRGTAEMPGLVVGLDAGGTCRGVALRVGEGDEEEALTYLRGREQVTFVYREERRPVQLANGTLVEALCYVVDQKHRQYGGALTLAEKARLVLQGHGRSGASLDYLESLLTSLGDMGLHDEGLLRLQAQVRLTGANLSNA
ncbi:MAG: gamma-glutamylcyclotransferase [Alphaproteobacteria bacterium]